MRKYILLLFLSAAAAVVVYNFIPVDDDLDIGLLRVGVECGHAPYNWEESSKSETNFPLVNNPGFYAEGYDVQMAALIAERLGGNVEFRKVRWENLINALLRREIDVIFSGMVDTEDRKKVISFSEPYEVRKTEYAVVVNSKSKYANAMSIKELMGARMIAQAASRFDEVINQIPRVVHLPARVTEAEIIDELLNMNADGTVVNYDTGLSLASMYRELRVIRFSDQNGFELGFTGLCAGVRKRDEKLLKKIDEAIRSISMRERQKIMDKVNLQDWKRVENFSY